MILKDRTRFERLQNSAISVYYLEKSFRHRRVRHQISRSNE